MTLSNFMATMKNQDIKVTLMDTEGNELIKFYSDGYTGIESDILSRTVKKFEITSASAVTVIINAPVDTEGTSTIGD